jgi:uncharacterized protein YaaN involved in tellurite resistance
MEQAARLAPKCILDPKHPETVDTVGMEEFAKSAAISDQLIGHARNNDFSAEVKPILVDLRKLCTSVDPSKLSSEHKGWLDAKLDFFRGKLGGYEHTMTSLDEFSKKITKKRDLILADVTNLGTLVEQNAQIIKSLMVWIQILKIKLQDLDVNIIPKIKAATASSSDPLAAQNLNEYISLRDRVDKRIYAHQVVCQARVQFANTVQVIRDGDILLSENLAQSLLVMIPLWKDQLATALALVRQKSGVDDQNMINDTTNALLTANATMLHDNAVAIATQSSRGPIDIATLKFTQDKFLQTIDDVMKISDDGAQQRATARQQLIEMDAQYKAKIESIAARH